MNNDKHDSEKQEAQIDELIANIPENERKEAEFEKNRVNPQPDKELIPEWILKYDQAGHQSSAGKAIRILLNIINGKRN